MDRLPAGRPGLGRTVRSLAATAQGSLASPAGRLPASRAVRPRSGRARPARHGRRAHGPARLTTALSQLAAAAQALLSLLWRRRRLRIVLLVGVIVAPLLGGGWLWLRHSSLVAVRDVRISGVHGPGAAAIDAALVRAAVAPFRVVRDVRVTASFPHAMRISVIEQPPVAALAAAGARTAVAADGVVLGPALLSGRLPTLSASSAPAPGQHVGGGWMNEALELLGAAPAKLARLTSRAYSGSEGLTLVLRSGLRAYFGDASRPHAKWAALALLLANEGSAEGSYIDVRVPERPVAGFAAGTAPSASTSSTGATAPSTVHSLSEATVAALAAGLPAESTSAAPAGSAAAEEEQGIKPRSSEGSKEGTAEGSGEGSRGRAGGAGSEGG